MASYFRRSEGLTGSADIFLKKEIGSNSDVIAAEFWEAPGGLSLNLSDTVNLSTGISSTRGLAKGLSDSISLSEAISARAYSVSLYDTLHLSDGPQKGLGKVISDPVEFSAQVSTTQAHRLQLSDNLNLSEHISSRVSEVINRSISDVITFSDARLTQRNIAREHADVITLSSELSTAQGRTKSLADNVIFSDAPALAFGRKLEISDGVNLSDAVSIELVGLNFYLSGRKISRMYLGNKQIIALYKGDQKI